VTAARPVGVGSHGLSAWRLARQAELLPVEMSYLAVPAIYAVAGRLGGPAATGDRFDEVTGPAAEDVAQCGERGQAEPFRDASDQPPDLLAGQRNTALG
jgi:hypothetical protein